MKKWFLLLSCVMLVALSIVSPVSAASYDDGSFESATYYATIPFDTVIFESGGSYSTSSYMQQFTLVDTSDAVGNEPTLNIETELVGSGFDAVGDPVTESLKFTFSQNRYENASSYYSAYNKYSIPESAGAFDSVLFTAESFGMDYLQYNALSRYGGVYMPAGSAANVTVSCRYYALDSSLNEWVVRDSSYSTSLVCLTAGLYSCFPTMSDLFGEDYVSLFPARCIPVESFTLSVQFQRGTFGLGVSEFSLGMTYGNHISFASIMADSVNRLGELKSTTETETVYVSVFEHGADLFLWLVPVLDTFFNTPLFGGFSIGGIVGFFLGFALFLLVIKFM